jgi:hypothetical protein
MGGTENRGKGNGSCGDGKYSGLLSFAVRSVIRRIGLMRRPNLGGHDTEAMLMCSAWRYGAWSKLHISDGIVVPGMLLFLTYTRISLHLCRTETIQPSVACLHLQPL